MRPAKRQGKPTRPKITLGKPAFTRSHELAGSQFNA
jgi:hypothetical protein